MAWKAAAHPGLTRLAGKPNNKATRRSPQVFKADVSLLLEGDELLQEEVFGPTTILVEAADRATNCCRPCTVCAGS
jgi:alpha-ketoglutaric semialdehyde dehydrogenase